MIIPIRMPMFACRFSAPLDLDSATLHVRGDVGETINTAPDPDEYTALSNTGTGGGSLVLGVSPQLSDYYARGNAPSWLVSSRMRSSLAAGVFSNLHNSGDAMFSFRLRVLSLPSVSVLFTTHLGTAESVGANLRWASDGTLDLQVANGTTLTQITGNPGDITTGDHTLDVVKSGANVSLLVDGVEVASGAIAAPSESDPAQQLWIGFYTGSFSVNALIPEMVFWDRVLSSAELAEQRAELALWA